MVRKQVGPPRTRRLSISLIEVIVALVLFSAMVAGLSASRALYNRKTLFVKTCDRLEKLCFQAYRFSAINVHVTTVVLQKEKGQWEAYLSLWGKSDTMQRVTQNCSNLKNLHWIRSIQVDGHSVSHLELQFFGNEGLALISGRDEYDHPLPPIDFIHKIEKTKQEKPTITIESSLQGVGVRKLALDHYCSPVTEYPSFPNEYIQCE